MISPLVRSPPSPPSIEADPLYALSPAADSPYKLPIRQCPAEVVALGTPRWGRHSGGPV